MSENIVSPLQSIFVAYTNCNIESRIDGGEIDTLGSHARALLVSRGKHEKIKNIIYKECYLHTQRTPMVHKR